MIKSWIRKLDRGRMRLPKLITRVLFTEGKSVCLYSFSIRNYRNFVKIRVLTRRKPFDFTLSQNLFEQNHPRYATNTKYKGKRRSYTDQAIRAREEDVSKHLTLFWGIVLERKIAKNGNFKNIKRSGRLFSEML